MKKTLTLLLLVITMLTFAQEYKIYEGTTDVTGKTIEVKIWPDDDFPLEFKMFNGYSSDKRYLVDRIVVGAKDSCYRFIMKIGDYCLLTDDDSLYTTPLSFDFPAKSYIPNPKDSTEHYGMSFHLFTCEKCIDHTVKYKLYTEGTPSENAEVTVNYTCANGIKSHDLGTISLAYPNPANGFITIDYSLNQTPKNAKIVFYDMLGKVVKETPIANKQGVEKINAADLQTGFYFYNFMVDGKTSNARKLIISGN